MSTEIAKRIAGKIAEHTWRLCRDEGEFNALQSQIIALIDAELPQWQPIDRWRSRLTQIVFRYCVAGNYVECLLCFGRSREHAHFTNVTHTEDCLMPLPLPPKE